MKEKIKAIKDTTIPGKYQDNMMSKFSERMLFFVFTPLAFFWGLLTGSEYLTTHTFKTPNTPEVFFGIILYTAIPIGIGLYLRSRRLKKEKDHRVV